ncbi:hypothetical protein HAX54_044398 [Datura stramonium]|uniref:Uncharacterized protein n=1 Tax=Datura stramonium TaxID=4076 RepID=A0ABS8SP56_DATST|nr:hypothetical protein [Datura stramonium]
MTGGGARRSAAAITQSTAANGGEFLLQLLQNHPHHRHSQPQPPPPRGRSEKTLGQLGIFGASRNASNSNHEFDQNLIFGSLRRDVQGNVSMLNDRFSDDSGKVGSNWKQRECFGNLRGLEQQNALMVEVGVRWRFGPGRQFHSGTVRGAVPPSGFSSKPRSRDFEHNADSEKNNFIELNHRGIGLNHDQGLVSWIHRSPSGSKLYSVLASDVEDSMLELHGEDAESGEETVTGTRNI